MQNDPMAVVGVEQSESKGERKGGTRSRLHRLALLLGAGLLAFSSFGVATAANAVAATPPAIAQADDATILANWVPYDGARIRTPDGCERRRVWLVNNVGWITNSNSDCWSYWTTTCPSTQYWMVVVNTQAALEVESRAQRTDPAAVACG
jgi:hypothetical protein